VGDQEPPTLEYVTCVHLGGGVGGLIGFGIAVDLPIFISNVEKTAIRVTPPRN
jgi:hypothetical protein